MVYKYIYIDDLFGNIEQGTINGLKFGDKLTVDHYSPNTWEVLIDDLTGKMPKADGLLLDLRLEMFAFNDAGQKAKYKGSTLAQELRTLVKEGKIKNDFPIVLISGDAIIEQSLDKTSCDLFEAVIEKEKLGNEISYTELRDKLCCFSKAYNELNLNSNKNIETILHIKDEFLDVRFQNTFASIKGNPNHIISRFILKQVVERPSFLIDEYMLAARLGVDIKSEEWSVLSTEILSSFIYSGIFSDFYKRWYMPLLEDWWEKQISEEIVLRSSSAEKRIELLNSKLNLNLTPILKDEESKSSSFWTVCIQTKKPIDTIDGFLIENQDDSFPWQEKKYICLEEALRELNYKVAPIEKNRLQILKEYYAKRQERIKK